MDMKELHDIFLKEDISDSIIGQDNVKRQMKSALISGRHMIIVGPPGIGKTTLAKDIARLLPETEVNDNIFDLVSAETHKGESKVKTSSGSGFAEDKKKVSGMGRFVRVQGSPDLTVEDLMGDIDPVKAMKFGPLSLEAFTPGKIFKANKGILFFDEVNRCSEKLQNALLQVLEEGKVTIGGYEVEFDVDFVFIGTMNPKDFSTENLSDVFLDRFDLVYMSYPETLQDEKDIVMLYGKKMIDVSKGRSKKIFNIIVSYTRSLRNSQKLERFPSVRATIGVYERAQANALIDGRKRLTISDFKEAMASVLSHRIKLKPSVKYMQSPIEVLEEEFGSYTKANNVDIEELSKDDDTTPEPDSGDDG
ncbi:MAG: AAA family ATPase [Candidatus Woesearchaeota archaeon]